jgi:hypothetical protein
MATSVTIGPGKVRTLSWKNDPKIRARMQVVHEAWMRGATLDDTRTLVHGWLLKFDPAAVPPSRATIVNDRKHLMELQTGTDEKMREQHLMQLDHVITVAYEELYKIGISDMAKPGLLNVVRQAIETKAKVGGTMVQRIEQTVTKSEPDQARLLVQVLVKHIGDEAKALMILEEMKAIDVPSKVITVEAPAHARS